MNIEDLIVSLSFSHVPMSSWDQTLVYSFYEQISRGSGFTEKQGTLAVRILKKHGPELSVFLKTDIVPFLQNPVFRLSIRKISSAKKLSIMDDPVFHKVIHAVFPYNEDYISLIRKNRDELGHAVWDKDQKCWVFSLTENNLQFLLEFSTKEQFELDAEIEKLFQQIGKIHSNIEQYIPMLVVHDKSPKLVNCHENVPQLETTDLLGAIFAARKYGITTWDETISNFLDSDEVDPITRSFLKTDPGESLHVDSEIHRISCLENIVKYMGPSLCVIPGGSELEILENAYNFLSNIGITNKEMSVMFRLPSGPTEIFNKFVKNNELNSPITTETKIVFVSSKLPKPVLKSKVKFHSVINLGFSNVHYSMKDFVGKHENLVFYSKKKQQREMTFAFM